MYRFVCGDSLKVLQQMESESVNTCVTSPPYYALRDYGKEEQIGLEETPEEYIDKLVAVFHEVKRVLKNDGTLWVNIADSYAGSGKGAATHPDNAAKYKQGTNKGTVGAEKDIKAAGRGDSIKPKDLMGIPWMLAFALRADGWYLRQDIIWSKPNPMPESVKDRCTKSHEYIFLLSKTPRYYYDYEAIQERATGYDGRKDTMLKGSKKYENDNYYPNSAKRQTMAARGHERWTFKNLTNKGQQPNTMHLRRAGGKSDILYPVRNKRDVWNVPTKPLKEAHFATFPKALITPCVLAGCPVGGTVLDCFAGSGTVAVVSELNNRNSIGIELNEEYIEIAKRRVQNEAGHVQVTMFDNEE